MCVCVCVCVCVLFNGISTFLSYLMPSPLFWKDSSGTIQSIAGNIRSFILFPWVFIRK